MPVEPDVPSSRQRQTLNARAALARKLENPDSRTAHYRDLGRKAAESRIVLSADEAQALRDAFALLSRIAERGKLAPRSEAQTGASDPSPGRHENAAEGESAASGGR